MNQHQASNCLTLAYWLADCMSDAEFRRFWAAPLEHIERRPELFEGVGCDDTFDGPGWFVLSGDLTDGLGIPRRKVDRVSIATMLVAVCDFSGWEEDCGQAE